MTTSLYRHFDASGNLLYVGISLSALTRLGQHRANAEWFRQITRQEMEHFPDRDAALKAECKAIQTEKPRYNKAMNEDHAAQQRAERQRKHLKETQDRAMCRLRFLRTRITNVVAKHFESGLATAAAELSNLMPQYRDAVRRLAMLKCGVDDDDDVSDLL